jgi:hypothetical protein
MRTGHPDGLSWNTCSKPGPWPPGAGHCQEGMFPAGDRLSGSGGCLECLESVHMKITDFSSTLH